MHPTHAPSDAVLDFLPPSGYEMPASLMPTAFGEFGTCGFEENSEDTSNYNQAMMYDPSSGMYMTCQDWQMPCDEAMQMYDPTAINYQMQEDMSMQQNSYD